MSRHASSQKTTTLVLTKISSRLPPFTITILLPFPHTQKISHFRKSIGDEPEFPFCIPSITSKSNPAFLYTDVNIVFYDHLPPAGGFSKQNNPPKTSYPGKIAPNCISRITKAKK